MGFSLSSRGSVFQHSSFPERTQVVGVTMVGKGLEWEEGSDRQVIAFHYAAPFLTNATVHGVTLNKDPKRIGKFLPIFAIISVKSFATPFFC